MAEISVGKLLPNLKVTLGDEEVVTDYPDINPDDSDSDSNVVIYRPDRESLQVTPKIYRNRDGGFTTGLDLLSQENSGILNKRAERFGLDISETSQKPSLSSLYESMGITNENKNSGKMKSIRLDAIHVRGVEELNTNEVFNYFQDYGPDSIEWINDCSCNVLWFDEISCARALLGLSKPLTDSQKHLFEDVINPGSQSIKEVLDISSLELSDNKEKEEAMEVDSENKSPACESLSLLDIPAPPGDWRLGVPHSKAKTVLLRFARKDDKKVPGAEKRSNYYKKHGNPNYGGLKGLISSSRKHKTQAAANRWAVEKGSSSSRSQDAPFSKLRSDSSVSKGSRQKSLRMRMYADDEELRAKKSRSRHDFPERKRSVHSRLGSKYTRDDLCHLGTYREDSQDEYESSSFSSKKFSWDKRSPAAEKRVDLRSKLKRLRSEVHTVEHNRNITGECSRNYRRERGDDYYSQKYKRVDDLKKESRGYYKRKYRSPLCMDDDSEISTSDD